MDNRIAFRGWLRSRDENGPPQPWREVCAAETRDQCERFLLDIDGGKHCEKMVLPVGRHPDRRRKQT